MIKEITNKDLEFINNLTNEYQVSLGSNPYNKSFYLTINDEIIGYIEYAIIYEKAELNFIYIVEKYRKKGYAQKLIDYMFNNLTNVSNITLEVNINNVSAIKLYEKNGFKIVSKRKNYYNGVDGYLMLKVVK